MMDGNRKINGGLYLVVNPEIGEDVLMEKLNAALIGGVDIIQIWNNWSPAQDRQVLINKICAVAHNYNVPVLINEDWGWFRTTDIDGVHFDKPSEHIELVREMFPDALIGVTCSNNLKVLDWAREFEVDYVSFCSVYPSPSVDNCEIVQRESVDEAREQLNVPLFASGGVTADRVEELRSMGFNGIAVISEIMDADNPEQAAKKLKQALK